MKIRKRDLKDKARQETKNYWEDWWKKLFKRNKLNLLFSKKKSNETRQDDKDKSKEGKTKKEWKQGRKKEKKKIERERERGVKKLGRKEDTE